MLLQWEDFATPHALPILDRYHQLLTFNDDIQGTAAVATAALSAAAVATGSRPRDQKIVMLGAGSAGIGVCGQIVRAMVADGLAEKEARAQIFVVYVGGLLTEDRRGMSPAQRRYAHPAGVVPAPADGPPRRADRRGPGGPPTALIGLSTATGGFTEDIVRAMASYVPRPIIMPLSNPTSRSEARPQDLADWTGGRAPVVAGSPFPAMKVGDSECPGRPVQQRVRVPGPGPGRDGGAGHPDHGRDDDRGGLGHLRRRHDPRRRARDVAARPG